MSKVKLHRKEILAAAVLLCLVAAVASPGFSIMAQPARVPHEDPAQAPESIDSISTLLFYSHVFSQASARRYQSAGDMLKEYDLARVPAEMRYMLDRYRALSRRLLDHLNNAENLLNDASSLVSQRQLARARQRLDDAGRAMSDAQIVMTDIEMATNLLGERTGVSSPTASNRLLETYQRLRDILNRLQELIYELDRLRQQLDNIASENPENPENPETQVIIQAIRKSASFYYQTWLAVSAPKEAWPGTPITVTGEVSSAGDVIDRRVTLLLDNTRMAEETTRSGFDFRVQVPPGISTGKHTLTLLVAPVERYAGASWSAPLSVIRTPLIVDARIPLWNVMPRLQVSGRVTAGPMPYPDGRVTVTFRKHAVTASTASDGTFSVDLSLPFDPSVFGPEEVTVSAEPKEPWFAADSVARRVFMIGAANTGLMVVTLISLGVLLHRRSRSRPGRPPVRSGGVDALPAAVGGTEETPRRYVFTGSPGRVVAAYYSAVRMAAEAAGLLPASHETLREYARSVQRRIPTAGRAFSELTAVVEMALYSGAGIDDGVVSRAEALARLVEESCRGAA